MSPPEYRSTAGKAGEPKDQYAQGVYARHLTPTADTCGRLPSVQMAATTFSPFLRMAFKTNMAIHWALWDGLPRSE